MSPLPPPPGTCLRFNRAEGSAPPLFVDFHFFFANSRSCVAFRPSLVFTPSILLLAGAARPPSAPHSTLRLNRTVLLSSSPPPSLSTIHVSKHFLETIYIITFHPHFNSDRLTFVSQYVYLRQAPPPPPPLRPHPLSLGLPRLNPIVRLPPPGTSSLVWLRLNPAVFFFSGVKDRRCVWPRLQRWRATVLCSD